jgi:hypothetical protein
MKKTLARAEDKADVLRRLQELRPDDRARWGRMSAPQAVCHLSDAFRAVLGHKPVSDASTLFHRTLLKWVALHVPMRWPPNVRTRPEFDQMVGGTKPAEFSADVADLQDLVETFTGAVSRSAWLPHPIFGPLTDAEWLRWGYLHMRHHLRQFGH